MVRNRQRNGENCGLVRKTPFGTHFPIIRDTSTDNMLSIFDSFFDEMIGNTNRARDIFADKARYPKANVYVDEDRIDFDIAVPGMTVDDLDVEFNDNVLTISGSTGDEEEREDRRFAVRELSRSTFKRSWNLSSYKLDVTEDRPITSSLKNGVLKVTIPLEYVKERAPTKVDITVD